MDVKSAFLNGKLKEQVYVQQPSGFESTKFPNHVFKLDKSLYGLKQASRAWYLKGTPNLGLWYPKCLGFDLKGYSDSDYVGCNIDMKSTSGTNLLEPALELGLLLMWSVISRKVLNCYDQKSLLIHQCENSLKLPGFSDISLFSKQQLGGVFLCCSVCVVPSHRASFPDAAALLLSSTLDFFTDSCVGSSVSRNLESIELSKPWTPILEILPLSRVAEWKNRILKEAARTMLSGSVFSKQYWIEAVTTTCYTQNRYQVDSNVVYFIDPFDRPEPTFTKFVASSNQNNHPNQNDQLVQNDEILNDDQTEHSNHTNDAHIIENLSIIEVVQVTEPLSSSIKEASTPNTTLVPPPYGKTIIVSKWIFRNKKDETGIVIKNKARLVAQCYRQEEGINYDETFAPVAILEEIMIFLAFATYMNFIVYQMNVKSAFLNGKLKEQVYVQQPSGFESTEFPNHVCKLDKSLYGLKQASRAWYLKGTPSLGLWYPKCLGFDLKGYSDSDYVGCNIDMKSTSAEAEYVAVARCCANILWMKNYDFEDNLFVLKNVVDEDLSNLAMCDLQTYGAQYAHLLSVKGVTLLCSVSHLDEDFVKRLRSVAFTDGSNSDVDNSRLLEKLEALTIKIDSQFQSLKEEMRKNYNNRGDLPKAILYKNGVGIKRFLDDLRVTAAKLMLLVYKLLLLVFRVNAAGIKVTTAERLQLLEEFMLTEKRSKTYQRKNKDFLKIKIT
ncbi:retrovirus-related pol polyprotein from transposon TNT 1-94 [Tanacetum coccineum]